MEIDLSSIVAAVALRHHPVSGRLAEERSKSTSEFSIPLVVQI
jgi:hypothetical protein